MALDYVGVSEYDPDLSLLQGSKEDIRKNQDLFQTQDMSKLVKTYLEEEVPEEIRRHKIYRDFWAAIGNTIKLTFLEKEDVLDFEYLFEDSRINFTMSTPPYDYTWDDMQILSQLKLYFVAAVKRAVGFQQHRNNERVILGGSINQVIRSNTEAIRGDSGGGGMMAKIRRFF